MDETYALLAAQMEELLDREFPLISNLSNAAALLYGGLDRINWAGFYLLRSGVLWLGPFGGKPACVRIELGKGVCGTAAAERRTVAVDDVRRFPGHIACDSASRSEIVLPLIWKGTLWGVLDIDSPQENRFTKRDQAGLERIAEILSQIWDARTL